MGQVLVRTTFERDVFKNNFIAKLFAQSEQNSSLLIQNSGNNYRYLQD